MTTANNFGKTVKTARKRRGLTLKQLAERVGSSASTISRFENGSLAIELKTFLSIAAELEFSVSLTRDFGADADN